MQPLHELLHRIKWDKEFGRGTFALAYDDRTAGEEKRVPFASISIDPGAFSFSLSDDEGDAVHIPLHRVHTVYKDGVIIWRRANPPAPRRSTGSRSS